MCEIRGMIRRKNEDEQSLWMFGDVCDQPAVLIFELEIAGPRLQTSLHKTIKCNLIKRRRMDRIAVSFVVDSCRFESIIDELPQIPIVTAKVTDPRQVIPPRHCVE